MNNNNVMDTIFMDGKLIKITEEMDLDNMDYQGEYNHNNLHNYLLQPCLKNVTIADYQKYIKQFKDN